MRRLEYNNVGWRRALRGLTQALRGLSRPFHGLGRPFDGPTRPLDRLTRPFRALTRPFRGLTSSTRLAIGLAAVILLYAFYKIILCDPHFLETTPRSFRHVIKLALALIVYGLGIFAFYKNSQGWVRSVWHILYIGILVLLTLTGVFDLLGGGLPVPVRVLTITMFEFLISPVPLVILVVVSRVMEMTPTKA